MSSQPLSRSVVQGLAEGAFGLMIGVTGCAFFTALGLHALGSLFTVGSPLLFGVIGVVTVALIALSISLRHAAHRLPPSSLSPEAAAQERRTSKHGNLVVGIEVAGILLVAYLLDTLHHGELIYPAIGLILGIGFLLLASLSPQIAGRWWRRCNCLTGVALTLLASGAVLALVFGVTFSGAYIWTVIVGLGTIMIFWLNALYLLAVGRRLLSQGAAMPSSSDQN